MRNAVHELPFLQSELLLQAGFVHGFSVRGAQQNRERFLAALGVEQSKVYELHQVHGDQVKVVSRKQQPSEVAEEQGDALVCHTVGLGVAVRVADCVPLLLADPDSGTVAAIHAGWRGIVAGVIEQAASVMKQYATSSDAWIAAVGPHIGPCCFEVGEDVALQIQNRAPAVPIISWAGPKPRANLALAVSAQLAQQGLRAERVQFLQGCTYCNEERFFSYRREQKLAGRHWASIMARKP